MRERSERTDLRCEFPEIPLFVQAPAERRSHGSGQTAPLSRLSGHLAAPAAPVGHRLRTRARLFVQGQSRFPRSSRPVDAPGLPAAAQLETFFYPQNGRSSRII